MTGLLLIAADNLDPFRKLRLFRKWNKGMDINPDDETFYTTQYKEAFLKNVENKYYTRHQHVLVTKPETILNNNLVSSWMAFRSGQYSYDPYDMSSDDKDYLMPNHVAEMTPGRSHCAVCILTGTRLYLIWCPESPQNWGKTHPDLNDYHCDPVEISWTL